MATAKSKYDEEFEAHLHKILDFKQTEEEDETKCDTSIIEYFGVFSLTDANLPDNKFWYIYYCKLSEIDETVERIFQKYGKKNLCELFRKPIFSGVSMLTRVKNYFAERKWHVKGNLLEAPPKSVYNDQRMVKTISNLHFEERKMLYNYISMKHNVHLRHYGHLYPV